MLRRSALAAATAAPLATPALVHAQAPTLRWRPTSSDPTSLDAIHCAAQVFACTVARLTEDRSQLRTFAPGEVVPGLQALDAVQAGTVECCHTTSSFCIGKNPAFAFAAGPPYGLNTRQQDAWMYEGGRIVLLNRLFRQYNAYALPLGTPGALVGSWSRKRFRTV